MVGRVLVFVSGRARRPDALLPEDTSGRQIAFRDPRFRLPHEEKPAAQLDRRRVIRRDAILHIGAIPLTGGRDQLKRVKRKPRMAIRIRLIVEPHRPLDARGILLESKDGSSGFGNLRQRLGRSPGKGDAVVMCWSEGNAAAVSRHNSRKWEQYRDRRQAWIV